MGEQGEVLHLGDLKPQGEGKNARKHNPRNIGMIANSMQEVGFASPLVIDEDNEIWVGNGRYEAASQIGFERVRVFDIEPDEVVAVRRRGMTEDQKTKLALYDNRAGELATWDVKVLAGLSSQGASLKGPFNDSEIEMLQRLAATQPSDELEGLEDKPLSRGDVPDALWATDNEWGVPLLDLHWQADAVDLPVLTWGAQARTNKNRGTYHFYTEDSRFDALSDDPTPVINSGCVNAVEPNFSCYDQMARAVVLHQVYRKRWLARYWQSKGVRIFVDLNVAVPHYDLNMLGVPQGWRAYATRGYTDRQEQTVQEWQLACERAGTEDILFLVYGGGKAVKQLAGERGWVWVVEDMSRAKGREV